MSVLSWVSGAPGSWRALSAWVAGAVSVGLLVWGAPAVAVEPAPVGGAVAAKVKPIDPRDVPALTSPAPASTSAAVSSGAPDVPVLTQPGASQAVTSVAAPGSSFDPDTSVVVSREERSQVWRNADGSFTTQSSTEPLNVLVDGSWVPVSTTVAARSGGGGQVARHPLEPVFAARANSPDLVQLSQDGASVSLALVGASGAVAQRSGSQVRYADVLGSADLVYEVTPGSVKESVVLEAAPAGPVTYRWRLSGSGFDVRSGLDGGFDLVGADGLVAMSI